MPPFASRLVDDASVALIEAWIRAMPPAARALIDRGDPDRDLFFHTPATVRV